MSVRAFVAVELAPRASRRIALLSEQVRAKSSAPRASWVLAENLHVTVKFLGHVAVDLVPRIADAVLAVGADVGPLRIQRAKLDAFPSPARAGVITLALDDAHGDLARVAASTEDRLQALGFEREARRFIAHVTLARTRVPCCVTELCDAAEPILLERGDLAALVLYRSHLAHGGPRYEPIARAPFELAHVTAS
jgi:2'-5' RNA ligase